MTKEQWLIKFQRELQLRNYAFSTIRTYAGCLSVFLDNYSKYNSFQDVEDIKSFLPTITNQNYHKQFVAMLQHFYGDVLKKQLSLKDIPYPRKTHYLPQILSVQEVALMIHSIGNLKHKAAIQLMYSCALRIGEVVKVEVAHIDGFRRLLLVKGAKGFKDRYVPIPAPTLELLRSYYQEYNPKAMLFKGQGGPYTARSIAQVFHRACKAVCIRKRVTPHSLRHSRLTHLKEAGIDIKELADIAGHNDIRTTEVYLHLAKETLVSKVAHADAYLSALTAKTLLIS